MSLTLETCIRKPLTIHGLHATFGHIIMPKAFTSYRLFAHNLALKSKYILSDVFCALLALKSKYVFPDVFCA